MLEIKTSLELWALCQRTDFAVGAGWSRRLLNEVFDAPSYKKLPREKWAEFSEFCQAESTESTKTKTHENLPKV